jgi:hypothetical protein
MGLVDMFIPHSWLFWASIVLIVFIAGFFNYLTHLSRNRMLRTLAELGHPVTPELVDRIDRV